MLHSKICIILSSLNNYKHGEIHEKLLKYKKSRYYYFHSTSEFTITWKKMGKNRIFQNKNLKY